MGVFSVKKWKNSLATAEWGVCLRRIRVMRLVKSRASRGFRFIGLVSYTFIVYDVYKNNIFHIGVSMI